MAELKDSGNRREFETGAVRDMEEGKGRMDLVPWGVCSDLYDVMWGLFQDDRMGFAPDPEHDKCWVEEHLINAYPKILVEMDLMDFLLNPTYVSNAPTPGGRLEQIKARFLHIAAIFCLHRWNFMIVPESIDDKSLTDAGRAIVNMVFGYAMLEVAKHYEDGARKYSENNWRKGIDPKIYFDSASRHLMKCMAGWTDEPHDRAFLWNCLCGAWECDAELYKIESCCNISYAVTNPISPVDTTTQVAVDTSDSIHVLH